MLDTEKLVYFRTRKAAVSYRELAAAAGLSYKTVFSAEKGGKTELGTIRKLAMGLSKLTGEKISPEDLMLPEQVESPVVELAGALG